METEIQKINCPACLKNDVFYFGIKNGFKLYKSQFCGLVFVWPVPENVASVYEKGYFKGTKNGLGYMDYEQDKKPARGTFIKFMEEIEKHAPQKGSLLDIGAANGYFIKIAQEREWRAKGVEISEYASGEGRKQGFDIITGTINRPELSVGGFDAITQFDVLEHSRSPEEDIQRCYSLLKPSGLLAINTPDSGSLWARAWGKNWQLVVPPEHLFLFSQKSLALVLARNNFKILTTRSIGKHVTLAYFFAFGHRWLGLGIFKWLAKVCDLKMFRWIYIPHNLRDNMFILAQKV